MNFISYLKPTVIMGQLNIYFLWPFNPLAEVAISIRREWSKKIVQQGRESLVRSQRAYPLFDARSVLLVRDHGKTARTPLTAFFIIPIIKQTFKGTL